MNYCWNSRYHSLHRAGVSSDRPPAMERFTLLRLSYLCCLRVSTGYDSKRQYGTPLTLTWFCTGVAEKYALIEQWRQQFPVESMCQVSGVSRSGYYNWVQHEPSDRKQSDERLKLEIKVAHIRTRGTYGTRRLQAELADNGIIVGRDRTYL